MPSANQDFLNMVSLNPNQHISLKFDEEMGNLRNSVLKMGGFVEQQIRRANDALRKLDTSKAEAVVRNDEYINALDAFARLDTNEAFDVLRDDEKADAEYQLIMRQMLT